MQCVTAYLSLPSLTSFRSKKRTREPTTHHFHSEQKDTCFTEWLYVTLQILQRRLDLLVTRVVLPPAHTFSFWCFRSSCQRKVSVVRLCNSVFLSCWSILLHQCRFELGRPSVWWAKTSRSIFLFPVLCNSCMLVQIFQATVTCNSERRVIGISSSLRGSREEIWGLSCHSSESHSWSKTDRWIFRPTAATPRFSCQRRTLFLDVNADPSDLVPCRPSHALILRGRLGKLLG